MDKKELKNFLKKKEVYPSILIGEYVNLFKQIYKGTILKAYSTENIRYILQEFEGLTKVRSGLLVLEGVGSLPEIGQNSLLKFIEESPIPILLLSYNDKIPQVILSRMKFVLKKYKSLKSLSFISIKSALDTIQEKGDIKGYEKMQFMAENCPQLYFLEESAGNKHDYMNKKLLSILTS